MIPREILKKIRQIEIRTNRVVTETLADFSFHPLPQFGRIPRAVPDGNHFDLVMCFVDGKIDCVRPAKHLCPAAFATGFGKSKRLGSNRSHYLVHLKHETNAESFRLFLIPSNRLPKFSRGLRLVDDPKAHFLYLSNISSRNSFHGVPRPGCFKASSARRSSSAICSGVSSSSNLLRSCSKTSRCSSNGSLSNCSKTWAALMLLNYSRWTRAQAANDRRVQSAIGNRQSAISP